MKKHIRPFIAVLPVLFALLLSGCVKLDAPEVKYIDSKIDQVTLEGIRVNFYFDIKNPNGVPLDITGYSYKVFINDRELLNDKRPGFSLLATETTRVTITTFVRYDKVVDSVLSVMANIMAGNMYVDYRVEGEVTGGTLGLTVTSPIKASGRLNVPKEMGRM